MRFVAVALFALFSTTTALAQPVVDTTDKWLSVDSELAGLAVYWNTTAASPNFSVTDASLALLDSVTWTETAPLVRQYRLEPGMYEFTFAGVEGSTEVQLEAGKLQYIFLDSTGELDGTINASFGVALEGSQLPGILMSLFRSGDEALLSPRYLEPAGKSLHFNTEPPFEIPRPRPDTEPKPK